MSLSSPKIIAAAGVAAVVVAVSLLWTCPGDDDRETAPLEQTDLQAPTTPPEAWERVEADNRVDVELDDPPVWTNDDGERLMEGPSVDGVDLEWSHKRHDGWNVAVGTGQTEGFDAEFRIWTAAGWPKAIVDVEARLTAEALAQRWETRTTIPTDAPRLLTGALEVHRADDTTADDIVGARFDDTRPTVSMHAPEGATGTHRTDNGSTTVDWTLREGLDDYDECLEEGELTRTTSSRIVVGFGDAPTVAPLAVPVGTRSLTTPIFSDAPAPTDDPWADGRAEDGSDLAGRYRTLAFGHSDPEDPRFGNGGLLAYGMGAIFTVSPGWWDQPGLAEFRDSIGGTDIEMATAGLEEGPTTDTRIAEPGDCEAIAAALAGDVETTVVRGSVDDPAYRAPLAAPLPAVLEAGRLPTERETILDRLFDAGEAAGAHRAEFAPLVATRNPLEDISEQNLLSPDDGGHWTLHDALTRRFSRLDLERDVEGHRAISFEDLRDHRRRHRTALPYWEPDGILTHSHEEAEHLVIFGDLDDLEIDVPTGSNPVMWRYDPTNLPVWEGQFSATAIEFVDPS